VAAGGHVVRYKATMGQLRAAFGPFVLTSDELTRNGKSVGVGARGRALLAALAEVDGPLDKAALLDAGWPGITVEEGNLAVQISGLRKLLGPRADGQEWIVTVPRHGYRLVRSDAFPKIPEAPRLPTLAVLPFHNASGDTGQEYFADGVVNELISAFSRFKSFAVISRSSSFVFKGRPIDVRQIATGLGARYVLEGSTRRGGDRVRITVQLVDGVSAAQLWAQTFEGTTQEVFEFEDRIVAAVAGLLEPQIQRAELEYSRLQRPGSLAAYDLYLRGVAKFYLYTLEGNIEAVRLLEQAAAIEPDNGRYLAYLVRALDYRIVNLAPFAPDDKQRCLARAHRAVELAPDDSTVLALCGMAMEIVGREYDRALLVTRRAVELNPNDTLALRNAGVCENIAGNPERAIELLFRTVAIQPNDVEALSGLAGAHRALGDYESAIAWGEKARAANHRYVPTYWNLVACYGALDRSEIAQQRLKELLQLVPDLTLRKLDGRIAFRDRAQAQFIVDAMRRAGLPEEG
jgi:TolB-like protein/Tfp pilus assembly protein PilF